MTVEELLSLVNKEVDTTKFRSLSQKTINEELNEQRGSRAQEEGRRGAQ